MYTSCSISGDLSQYWSACSSLDRPFSVMLGSDYLQGLTHVDLNIFLWTPVWITIVSSSLFINLDGPSHFFGILVYTITAAPAVKYLIFTETTNPLGLDGFLKPKSLLRLACSVSTAFLDSSIYLARWTWVGFRFCLAFLGIALNTINIEQRYSVPTV